MGLGISSEEGPIMRCRVFGGLLERRVTDLPFKIGDSSIVVVKALPVTRVPPMRRNRAGGPYDAPRGSSPGGRGYVVRIGSHPFRRLRAIPTSRRSARETRFACWPASYLRAASLKSRSTYRMIASLSGTRLGGRRTVSRTRLGDLPTRFGGSTMRITAPTIGRSPFPNHEL
jgi:hypothetical protein